MFTPTLNLFYFEGSDPKEYELEISVDTQATSGLKLSNYKAVPNTPYENQTFLIEVVLGTDEAHVTTMRVPLELMNPDSDDWELEVNLVDSFSTIKGKGKVRAEEAQQESRPIEEF